jgi:hypothetical protein
MGSCTWFGAVSRDLGYRESVVVLSGEQLGGGRRATMWVSAHYNSHPRRRELR